MQFKTATPAKLLNVDANPKTVKNHRHGYLTGVLYLAPADLSGFNVCPMAEIAKCKAPCLNTAGRGQRNSVQQARVRKTQYFFNNPDAFMQQLIDDITKLARQAKKRGLKPLVRLNGTSDIKWENVRIDTDTTPTTIFQLFPDIQFYDYTKINNRKTPANYDLTFSHSGVPEFQKYTRQAIKKQMRVAVVFDKRETVRSMVDGKEKFLGMRVVDGDDTDVRHLDGKAVAVGLYAKGKARKDVGGFVIRDVSC